MEAFESFFESQQAMAKEIKAAPPILPNKIPPGSVRDTPNSNETATAGMIRRTSPVAPSMSAVNVRRDFILKSVKQDYRIVFFLERIVFLPIRFHIHNF
jgi:hypothetical protein